MAERGAHLTGTTHARPSIFEVVAQESLAATLQPAFKKIISFLVSCSPERFGWLTRCSDEAYLVFNATLQYHYLRKYAASFSETFYGLKRVTLVSAQSNGRLPKQQERLSLFFLVLFPYLRNKLAEAANAYRLSEADGRGPKDLVRKFLRELVVKGHTIFHIIYECSVLYQFLVYMSGWSWHPGPLLRLASVTLTYSDTQKSLKIGEVLGKLSKGSFQLQDGLDLFGRAFTRLIELGAFFLQFLQWWNQENYNMNFMALPVPPPPPIPEVAKRYKGLCPICHKARHIHTALPVSGYVFCYQCILKYLQEHRKCPVTGYPANEDDLVRLYVE